MAQMELIEGNQKWVKEILANDPDFFTNSAKGQEPKYLWIGCSDSRVPAELVTKSNPGEIFVHRNIANMVVSTDMSMLSVLQYSVEVLEVDHVIICGHYGCGGVKAALSNQQIGLIDNWLANIKDVYRFHEAELTKINDSDQVFRRMVELNVMEQVHNLATTNIVQNAWKKRQMPEIHGFVYDLATGGLKDLNVSVNTQEELDEVYKFLK